MPYIAIYRDAQNGALREFDTFIFNGAWHVKTARGSEPLAYRLRSGLVFYTGAGSDGFRYKGEPRLQSQEPVPPIPVPDPVTMPDDFDAYVNELRYGSWSITTAYQFAKNPVHSSADLEMKCQSDFGFREALDASAGLEHLLPAAPPEMRTPAKTEQRYKTLSQLTSSQSDYINRKARVGGWAHEKSFSLIVDRNGLWRDSGEFAAYGGYVVAECRECHRKAKYPLSGWVNGECRCDCGAGDNYSENGARLE